MPGRRTTSLDVWCRVQKPLLALTTDLQSSDLLRIVLPRSAYGDVISNNNYDHVVSTEGVQLPLDVALPMHCLDTDAAPRCQPRACRHVPVSTSRVMLPPHGACPWGEHTSMFEPPCLNYCPISPELLQPHIVPFLLPFHRQFLHEINHLCNQNVIVPILKWN